MISVYNHIGAVGGGRLRASWRGQASRLLLEAPCTACSLYHLFSRQATRNSDILYTYSVVAFGLGTFPLSSRNLHTQHDLYLIASLWVVAAQVRASLTIFELSSVKSSWSESSLKCSPAIQSFISKRKRGKCQRWRTGVAALPGASACNAGGNFELY